MSSSVNIDLNSIQKQPSIDHAVWGHISRPMMRYGLGLLALFAAAGLALAGSKMS